MHQNEILVGIGTKKQTNYATALADGDIDKVVVFNSPDITSHEATKITDAEKLGKGHDFITEVQTESFAVNRKFDFDAVRELVAEMERAGWLRMTDNKVEYTLPKGKK